MNWHTMTAELVRSIQCLASAQQRLPQTLPHLERCNTLFTFALRLHGSRVRWAHHSPMHAALADFRIHRLHPHQQETLSWLTGMALAETQPKPLLALAWTVARAAYRPAEWEPWMGPRSSLKQRPISLKLLPEGEEEAADTPDDWEHEAGDPEPAPPRQPGETGDWVPIQQVLDGLDAWQAAIQEHFGLPLGDMALHGHPHWQRLVDRLERSPCWDPLLPEALPELPAQLWHLRTA